VVACAGTGFSTTLRPMTPTPPAEQSVSFVEPIKAGHVFFYDTQTDEVVHLRRDIFEAARENSEGMDLELTKAEELDAEDAWEILADENGRYLQMPLPSQNVIQDWEREFEAAGLESWDDYYAARLNELLLVWLDNVEVEPSAPAGQPGTPDQGLRRSRSR
jgi:hypothetical protein